jgi:hypothetical protein
MEALVHLFWKRGMTGGIRDKVDHRTSVELAWTHIFQTIFKKFILAFLYLLELFKIFPYSLLLLNYR